MSDASENRRALEAAGYVFDKPSDYWTHPTLNRILAGGIASALTQEQLGIWIKAGTDRARS